MGDDDDLGRALEGSIVQTAQPPDAHPWDWLPTVPGLGNILRRVRLEAKHDLARFPRGQDCMSSCRLVQGAKASAGQREGTAGTTSGTASLTGAVSEAAVLAWRAKPQGQHSLARATR